MPWTAPPPGPLTAPAAGVDLWLADACPDDEAEAAARAVLSPDELARCDRLLVPEKRRQATAVRAALRHILARYVGVPAAALRFAYGEHEKPALPHPATPDVQFNVSHSGAWGLVGVTAGRPLGVDIEQRRAVNKADSLARTVLAEAELRTYAELDEAAALEFLFTHWAIKEAALKAHGVGMSVPPRRVECHRDADRSAVAEFEHAGQRTQWSVAILTPTPGYVGAFALPAGAACPTVQNWLYSAGE